MVGAEGWLLDGPGLWTGGPGLHDDLKLGLVEHPDYFEALLAAVGVSQLCAEPPVPVQIDRFFKSSADASLAMSDSTKKSDTMSCT